MDEQGRKSLQLQANAKINLTLDVGRLRPDGYHEISSVMQTVDLVDTLDFTATPEGITVTCTPPGAAPDGPSNLAHQALQSVADRAANGPVGGINLHIIKRIPAAAGLGGGSSDAAAALKGANALYGLKLTDVELISLAARLGSDVAFFIRGGAALAQGRGETVSVLPPWGLLGKPQWLVLVKPEAGVSTAEIYARCPKEQGGGALWTTRFVSAAARGDRDGMLASMNNDLEAVTAAVCPQVYDLINRLEQLGAERALMSGSGPTVFGVFPGEEEARTAARRLEGGPEQVFVCRTTMSGKQPG
jgi:4-diphosphocytidyl-2-C-methyl-D-erythritol kinase